MTPVTTFAGKTVAVFGLGASGLVTCRALAEGGATVVAFDDAAGKVARLIDDLPNPNGVLLSPDEKTLYLVTSRAEPREIVAYDVNDDNRITNRRVLIDAGPGGTPDGFRLDEDGNLWCGWGMGTPELDGVMIFNPAGAPIGRIQLPERCANMCFGGRRRNRLFMAASQSIYGLYVNTRGAR